MPRVVHFEIPADSPARAVEFYKKVFGWDIQKWGDEEYWLAATGKKDTPGIDGAIMDRNGTARTVVNTIGVSNYEEFVAKVKHYGGTQVSEKQEIPNVGTFCYCKDTEGNLFGILEPAPGSTM